MNKALFAKANPFNLQMFADGSTAARRYELEFKELIQAVFGVQAYFRDMFVGDLEALDGVRESDTAFTVKTSDIPVVINKYSKDEDVAFGKGTGNSSRFGERTEITYVNEDVPYTHEWAFHEGIDYHKVNNDVESAVYDRLELQAIAKIELFNAWHGDYITENAGKQVKITTLNEASVIKAFNDLNKYFTDIGARGTRKAKVCPDVYAIIQDCTLTTSSKKSSVNIDNGDVLRFKGFDIEEVPTQLFAENEYIKAYIAGIGKCFTGINTARTIESEDFDGLALQGAGKAGEYVPEVNKKAIAVVNSDATLGSLTVSSAKGTAAGMTKITVSGKLAQGHSYKYKLDSNETTVELGQNVRGWSAWDGKSEIKATAAQTITVVDVDAAYCATAKGSTAVTVKAE